MADAHQTHLSATGAPYATYLEGDGNNIQLYQLGSNDPLGNTGAFADLAAAIQAATKFIFICDWSFQPYVRLGSRATPPALPQTVGAILNARAKAGVLVAVHVWDHTNAGAADDQNDAGSDRLDDIAKALGDKGGRSANLLWRKSSRAGVNAGFSLHQKYVVLDAGGVVKAFFGGLDMTKGRFDWHEHPIAYPGASGPLGGQLHDKKNRTYDDFYNAEFSSKQTDWWDQHAPFAATEPGDVTMPRQPWQDYYAQVTGPAAWDILREFVGRWNAVDPTGLPHGNYQNNDRERVETLFRGLFDASSGFKKPWEDHGGPFTARVVRSIADVDWGQRCNITPTLGPTVNPLNRYTVGPVIPCNTATANGSTQTEFTWSVPGKFESSIEQAYVNAIQQADRFVYIESQYFIGSGASWSRPSVGNRIPKTIVDNIVGKIAADKPFHAYIVIPMFPEGDPIGSAAPDQRQFEWSTISYMAKAVSAAATPKGKDWSEFLSFYFLANWTKLAVTDRGERAARVKANQRYMVYVHSKLMICDDDHLILGSANLNERSLAGNRDAEICVYMFAGPGKAAKATQAIQDLRLQAWTDHYGGPPPDWQTPEKPSCSSAMQAKGRANWTKFTLGADPTGAGHLVAWPFSLTQSGFYVATVNGPQDQFIFDAATDANGTVTDLTYMWASPLGGAFYVPGSLAE